MIYTLTENAINGVLISEKIRDEDLHEFYIIDRLDFIDDLIKWISECKNSDKNLMMQDLKILINLDDEFIFSSNSTNLYLHKESFNFNNVCNEILEINKNLKKYD